MKQKTDIRKRQNDRTALTLLKASYRCLKNERVAKYIMIALSFGICLAAIFNKYLPKMASDVPNIIGIQETAATYINLISGVILVAGIVIGFYTTRMHTEGVVLQDRYDAYVFDNPPNLSVLRPISQTVINVYAQKTKRKDEAFRNYLYSADSNDPDPETAQFDYINDTAHSDYKLYLSIQPFFMTLWIGFCVIIVLLAVSFNDKFVTTLINIMIPSLSAVSTIGNSWYNCRLQMKQLQNLLTVIDQIQRLPADKRDAYIRDAKNIRALADGLFNYRASAFVIPNFLVRRHLAALSAEQLGITFENVKTEMPTLVLPDLETAAGEINNIIDATEAKTVTFSKTRTVSDVGTDSKGVKYTAPKRKLADRNAAPTAKPAATAKSGVQKVPGVAPRAHSSASDAKPRERSNRRQADAPVAPQAVAHGTKPLAAKSQKPIAGQSGKKQKEAEK